MGRVTENTVSASELSSENSLDVTERLASDLKKESGDVHNVTEASINISTNQISAHEGDPTVSALMRKKEAVPVETECPAIADRLVEYLVELGVEFVFGVPGGAIEPFYNALARAWRKFLIQPVTARGETAAAFMADGYFRERGTIGVCCATSGPGATNLITGVACAYENNIPMLVITAQTNIDQWGRYPAQDSSCSGINTVEMFRHCTRYSSSVTHPDQFEYKLIEALQHALWFTPGPVHLSIPRNMFNAKTATSYPAFDVKALFGRKSKSLDLEIADQFYEQMKSPGRKVMLIGAECIDAVDEVMHYAVLLGVPFVATTDAKGLVSPQHPFFRGIYGYGGHESARALVEDETLEHIIAIGANLGEWNTDGWNQALLSKKLIHIDQVPANLVKTPMAGQHIRGSILALFQHCLKRYHQEYKTLAFEKDTLVLFEERRRSLWNPAIVLDEPRKYTSSSSPIKPQRLMYELSRSLPQRTRFFADIGNSAFWATHYLQPEDSWMDTAYSVIKESQNPQRYIPTKFRRSWFHATPQFAPMGWAIGAAVGAAMACKQEALDEEYSVPVVCITGDGSWLLSSQEFSVAVAERLPIIFVILNDAGYGMVRHGQKLSGAERVATEIPPTDFLRFGIAMRVDSYRIDCPSELARIEFRKLCGRFSPTILDVRINPEEMPPIGDRVKTLHGSSMTPKTRMVSPISSQSDDASVVVLH
jgi:acetolactate synthase I/II/III large subunit